MLFLIVLEKGKKVGGDVKLKCIPLENNHFISKDLKQKKKKATLNLLDASSDLLQELLNAQSEGTCPRRGNFKI